MLRSQPALSENPRVQVKTQKNSNKVVQIQKFSYFWPQIRKINKIKQSIIRESAITLLELIIIIVK